MELLNYKENCRICLKAYNVSKNIFSHIVEGCHVPLAEIIFSLFGIELHPDNAYPQCICRKCLTEVENILLFKEGLIRSEDFLLRLFNADYPNYEEKKTSTRNFYPPSFNVEQAVLNESPDNKSLNNYANHLIKKESIEALQREFFEDPPELFTCKYCNESFKVKQALQEHCSNKHCSNRNSNENKERQRHQMKTDKNENIPVEFLVQQAKPRPVTENVPSTSTDDKSQVEHIIPQASFLQNFNLITLQDAEMLKSRQEPSSRTRHQSVHSSKSSKTSKLINSVSINIPRNKHAINKSYLSSSKKRLLSKDSIDLLGRSTNFMSRYGCRKLGDTRLKRGKVLHKNNDLSFNDSVNRNRQYRSKKSLLRPSSSCRKTLVVEPVAVRKQKGCETKSSLSGNRKKLNILSSGNVSELIGASENIESKDSQSVNVSKVRCKQDYSKSKEKTRITSAAATLYQSQKKSPRKKSVEKLKDIPNKECTFASDIINSDIKQENPVSKANVKQILSKPPLKSITSKSNEMPSKAVTNNINSCKASQFITNRYQKNNQPNKINSCELVKSEMDAMPPNTEDGRVSIKTEKSFTKSNRSQKNTQLNSINSQELVKSEVDVMSLKTEDSRDSIKTEKSYTKSNRSQKNNQPNIINSQELIKSEVPLNIEDSRTIKTEKSFTKSATDEPSNSKLTNGFIINEYNIKPVREREKSVQIKSQFPDKFEKIAFSKPQTNLSSTIYHNLRTRSQNILSNISSHKVEKTMKLSAMTKEIKQELLDKSESRHQILSEKSSKVSRGLSRNKTVHTIATQNYLVSKRGVCDLDNSSSLVESFPSKILNYDTQTDEYDDEIEKPITENKFKQLTDNKSPIKSEISEKVFNINVSENQELQLITFSTDLLNNVSTDRQSTSRLPQLTPTSKRRIKLEKRKLSSVDLHNCSVSSEVESSIHPIRSKRKAQAPIKFSPNSYEGSKRERYELVNQRKLNLNGDIIQIRTGKKKIGSQDGNSNVTSEFRNKF